MTGEGAAMKNYYVAAIAELAESCNDISLLDLIYRLLAKSAEQEAAKAAPAADA